MLLHVKARKKNIFIMLETNPVIGSGFDTARGTFAGDTQISGYHGLDNGQDHPFYNVDQNTMMVCTRLLVLF